MPAPVVFISYSHESEAHRDHVLALSERLREDGFDTRLDRYINGSPPEGWARWMMDQVDAAEWVLVVCTETYYRRFRGHEVPGVGKGVDFEGLVITQALYDARSVNEKFVPVVFDAADAPFIPEPLRPVLSYELMSESGYTSLLDALRRVAGIESRPIGDAPPVIRPTAEPLRFDSPSRPSPDPAVAVWRRKRDFLLAQLPTATGTEKFALHEALAEADRWIQQLERGG